MHLEFLIEDQSGKIMLEGLVPKIIDSEHTYKIHAYKGIGKIPKNLKGNPDPAKRILLDRLPQLLNGYGKVFSGYPPDYSAAVVVVCDLDNRDLQHFMNEINTAIDNILISPRFVFCLAIEEGEAWLLGDLEAIKKAYPNVKLAVLADYEHDSICGTWEKLADALYIGGATALKAQGYQVAGKEKSIWARNISMHMNVRQNKSPSFKNFMHEITLLVEI